MDHAVLTARKDRAAQHDQLKLRLYLDGQDVFGPYNGDSATFSEVAALIEAGADRHL